MYVLNNDGVKVFEASTAEELHGQIAAARHCIDSVTRRMPAARRENFTYCVLHRHGIEGGDLGRIITAELAALPTSGHKRKPGRAR